MRVVGDEKVNRQLGADNIDVYLDSRLFYEEKENKIKINGQYHCYRFLYQNNDCYNIYFLSSNFLKYKRSISYE